MNKRELKKVILKLEERARENKNILTFDILKDILIEDKLEDLDKILVELNRRGIEFYEEDSLELTETTDKIYKSGLNIFYNEVARLPLLSREEEMFYAAQLLQSIEELGKLFKKYKINGKFAEKYTKFDIDKNQFRDELHKRLKKRKKKVNLAVFMRKYNKLHKKYRQAWSKLVCSNLRLVIKIAKKYTNNETQLQDLINEGCMGLMRAVSKYDYRLGFRFCTYAAWWIRQMIVRALSQKEKILKIPTYLAESLQKFYSAEKELKQKLGKEPTIEEIAEYLDVDYEKLEKLYGYTKNYLYLDNPLDGDSDLELKDCIDDLNYYDDVEEEAEKGFLMKLINKSLEKLNEREKKALILRFGLYENKEYTLEEIGKKIGVSKERARQIINRALSKIRTSSLSKELNKYLNIGN